MLSSNLSQASLKRPCSNNSRPSSKAVSACSLAVALGACAALGPAANRHRASVKAAPARADQRRAEEQGEGENELSMLSLVRVAALASARWNRDARLGIPQLETACGKERAAYI